MVASPLDGRYGPMDPRALAPLIERLVAMSDLQGIDHILGIPEGGTIPAFAFAARVGRTLALASSWEPEVSGVITFLEEHDGPRATKSIYGLARGERVLIVEDEVTTGRTALNCVRALRAAGIGCDQVATVLSLGGEPVAELLRSDGIRLHVAHTIDPETPTVIIE